MEISPHCLANELPIRDSTRSYVNHNNNKTGLVNQV